MTGEAELIEHTSIDHYWADGGDETGQNRLAQLLMELRKLINDLIFAYRYLFNLQISGG